MKSPIHNILIIEPKEEIQKKLTAILRQNSCRVKAVNNANDGIQLAIKNYYDLIICQKELSYSSGYQVFKMLKEFLLKEGTSFFLIVEKLDQEDVLVGLEMGIDNFILRPINKVSVLNKIDNNIRKIYDKNIFESNQLIDFLDYSPVAKFIIENQKVVDANNVFCKLVRSIKNDLINKRFVDLFELNSNSQNALKYKKLENGLITNCYLKKVRPTTNFNIIVDIYMYSFFSAKRSKIFVEIIPATLKSGMIIMNVLEFESDERKVSEAHKRVLPVDEDITLTKRESEIFDESAKGFPIKQIASNLNLSERTVEKHRSNIMGKTNTHSILEAILVIQKNTFFQADKISRL